MEINRVILIGSEGRMGRSLIEVISDGSHFIEIIGIDHIEGKMAPLTADQLGRAQIAIDFSSPSGTKQLVDVAGECDTPLIIGTTGLGASLEERIRELSERIPVVRASNFSMGINLLLSLVGTASRVLGEDFCPEIMEIHHKMKKDAPSGTALSLGDAVLSGRQIA
ncbi:4-hydroxy-tetrahydrodipicolinate reductase, partial [Myxococcota bacterium]|nr:4-hydroxy-tetrahydrodipicolinate reductase [Myxococcota bacterium]